MFFPGHSFPLSLLILFLFFPLSLTSRFLLSHTVFLSCLPNFLFWGMENSCTFWKSYLMCCQLCSIPSSLRTVSQRISSSHSLSSLKFASLKFKALILLFARPVCLDIVNLTWAWLWQPRLPPVLTYSMLLSTRSSNTSPLVGLSSTWTRKFNGLQEFPGCLAILPTILWICQFF